MWPSHGAFCISLSRFFWSVVVVVYNFVKYTWWRVFSCYVHFLVCVFFWSLEFSWEFFFKIFVILLLDLFSNFVLVRIKKGSFLGLFVVSFLISIPLSSLLLVCLSITFPLWFKTCWVSKSLFSSTSLTTFSLYLFLTPWRRRTRSCRGWWWWCS